MARHNITVFLLKAAPALTAIAAHVIDTVRILRTNVLILYTLIDVCTTTTHTHTHTHTHTGDILVMKVILVLLRF